MCALLLIVTVRHSGASDYVLIRRGTLPIVISAPHGGTGKIEGVPARNGEGLAAGPSGFVTVRDSSTDLLAIEFAAQLRRRLGGSPWLIVSRVHRRYVDFNRPVPIALEHPRAQAVYDTYHNALQDACSQVRTKHQYGLLLDLHGQGADRTDARNKKRADGQTASRTMR